MGSFHFSVGQLIVVFLRKLVDRESRKSEILGNRWATNFLATKKGAQPCVPFWVRVGSRTENAYCRKIAEYCRSLRVATKIAHLQVSSGFG